MSDSNQGPRSENGLLGSTSQRQKQGREQLSFTAVNEQGGGEGVACFHPSLKITTLLLVFRAQTNKNLLQFGAKRFSDGARGFTPMVWGVERLPLLLMAGHRRWGAIHSHLCTSALQQLCHSLCFTKLKSPRFPWQQIRFSRLVSSYFQRVTKCRRRPFEEHHLQSPEGSKQHSQMIPKPTLKEYF